LSTQVAKLRDSNRSGGKSSGTRYDGGTDHAANTTYVVRSGDTLFRIASAHRVSVGEIQQLNRMTEDEVRVGQTLLIPSPHRLSSSLTQASYKPAAPGNSAPATTTSTTTTASLYHMVKKGESLKAIALKHKMTTSALASANKIKDVNKIVVGQQLKIPGRTITVASRSPAPARESSHTVPLPGFGTSDAAPTPPAAGLTPASTPPDTGAMLPAVDDSHRGILAYRVDRSDTIETIATQFSTTPARIREINRLDASTPLKPGDEIMVLAMGAVSLSSR
jgi:LysM repeat protein